MTSPQFQKLYAQLKSQPDQAAQSIEALRASHAARSEGEVLPPDVRLTPVDAGGVPAEWSDMPGSDPARVLLFFHGGAYFRGSIATVREVTARIARAAGARALSVGYRLAPEHPFPAEIEDAESAYRWLLAQGVSPRNVAVAGASAGG
ncbi:MAG: alpha/beta hydrolase, partial [Candidatus Lambdaproteobacteria bacterium]|nr:alpha/beta hydrolase [Candidatus Lambdaproteobacteria bacterium]